VSLLQEIKKHSTKDWNPLVLISEWGEELGPNRSDICEEVARSTGIRRVFPAEWRQRVALRAGNVQPICAYDASDLADHWHVTKDRHIEYLCPNHGRQYK
jgi:hypothetical protein